MDKIPKISKEFSYRNLVYNFWGPSPSKNFAVFSGPTYTYNPLKNGEKHCNK